MFRECCLRVKIECMTTEIIVAGIGVLCAWGGIVFTSLVSRRENLTLAYHRLVQAQGELKQQIDAQDRKIDGLISQRDEMQTTLDEETAYIRQLGHWLACFCEIIDPEFLERNPKPKLPDCLRDKFPNLQ